jgi:nucleotide-binding universal stress UspA family protein
MNTNIMVPLDGSLFSEQALFYALEVAKRADARVHLVMVRVQTPNVLRRFAVNGGRSNLPETELEDEREYLTRLEEAATWQAGIAPVTALLFGDVVTTLEDYAASNGIDLVIMTTHGRSGVARAWLGSVADALLHRLSVPMLLLRPRAGETVLDTPSFALDHILVPIDGSSLSETAIPAALTFGRLTNARYTLAQIVAPPMMIAMADSIPVPLSQQTIDDLKATADAYLERLATPLRQQGYVVDTRVVAYSTAANGIQALARNMGVDLIALATHARSGIKRLALGSVADLIVHGSSLPVLLLRSATKGDML